MHKAANVHLRTQMPPGTFIFEHGHHNRTSKGRSVDKKLFLKKADTYGLACVHASAGAEVG
jgi:hypothetical protein